MAERVAAHLHLLHASAIDARAAGRIHRGPAVVTGDDALTVHRDFLCFIDVRSSFVIRLRRNGAANGKKGSEKDGRKLENDVHGKSPRARAVRPRARLGGASSASMGVTR